MSANTLISGVWHNDVHTVEDKKTFPFDVLQNGTVCIVVRCVLRNGIKTLQKRYALKTVVERLYYCCGTIYSRVAFVGVATCTRGVGREIEM